MLVFFGGADGHLGKILESHIKIAGHVIENGHRRRFRLHDQTCRIYPSNGVSYLILTIILVAS